jgi:hypothetical protein
MNTDTTWNVIRNPRHRMRRRFKLSHRHKEIFQSLGVRRVLGDRLSRSNSVRMSWSKLARGAEALTESMVINREKAIKLLSHPSII